jgi:glycosyltransferase involved in cell wall biosynthesis
MGASVYVVTGKKSLEYLEKFGFEQDDIPVIGNPVDNSYFSQDTPDKDRRKEGVSILFVGNLSKRKGFDVLLEAFDMIDNKKNKLNIVGDGPLSKLLTTKSRCSNSAVRYFGKLNRTELTKLYREVDIFVLPSRYDLWGVVINEAMNSGLPIVTTNNVGAAGDLVVDGKNGYVVDSNDAVSLSNALTSLSNNEDLRLEMGKSSRRIISNWGLSRAAAGLDRAVDNIVSSSNNTSNRPRLS